MDFQAPNPAPEKASGFINNEILVSKCRGVVCFTVAGGLSSNLNLSNDVLKTIAEQLFTENEVGNKQCIASHSDATTVDSDDPTSSDCSANRTCLLPPVGIKALPESKLLEIKPKRRGGWPKGRKHKSAMLHLPPKAPATGYTLYLNEMRHNFKNCGLAMYEMTKILGNQWSNLTLEQKQPYLLRAEEDKRRYREELREYRQSGSYQLYLAQKRKKRVQNNILSESDMDATDDIDDEDNEELYCRTCDQWFHNLHNKREHLQSRLHFRAVVDDMQSELESETEGSNIDNSKLITVKEQEQKNVSEIIVDLIAAASRREKDIKNLNMIVEERKAIKDALSQQLSSLIEREAQLKNELNMSQVFEKDLETKIFDLWQVPSLFITTDLASSDIEGSEYSVTE